MWAFQERLPSILSPRDLLKVVWFTWTPSTLLLIVYSFEDCRFCIELIIIIPVLVTLRLNLLA